MDIKDVLHNAVSVQRTEALKTSSQLLLGELILKVEAVKDKGLKVFFDFSNAHPAGLRSWRGSYEELAIEYEVDGNPLTVEIFLQQLKDAVGSVFQGYKGGDFRMGKNTPVWAANYGDSGNAGVVDVAEEQNKVILKTAKYEL